MAHVISNIITWNHYYTINNKSLTQGIHRIHMAWFFKRTFHDLVDWQGLQGPAFSPSIPEKCLGTFFAQTFLEKISSLYSNILKWFKSYDVICNRQNMSGRTVWNLTRRAVLNPIQFGRENCILLKIHMHLNVHIYRLFWSFRKFELRKWKEKFM